MITQCPWSPPRILQYCNLISIPARQSAESGWNWDAIAAVGTIFAALVALGLGWWGIVRDRNDTAHKVGAWITDEYRESLCSKSYDRSTQLHVSNMGNDPIFDINLSVFIGEEGDMYSIGALSAPVIIQTMQPQQQLTYDITTPLKAHYPTWSPKAEVLFRDSRGIQWIRRYNGHLQRLSRKSGKLSPRQEPNLRFLGIMPEEDPDGTKWPSNPMAVAMIFLRILNENKIITANALSPLLSAHAAGWDTVDWDEVRTRWMNLSPAGFVRYPAPKIAQVILVEHDSQGKEAVGGPALIKNARVMTLNYENHVWRIYGIGKPLLPTELNLL